MKTLVLVEHDNTKVNDATLAVVTAAAKLGEVHLPVAGHNCGAVAEAAAKIAGVGKVHVADDAAYANGLAENVAPLAASLMDHHDAFLAAATTTRARTSPRALPHSST
jgi:Electron transfer flavoprotein, alpha subunit